jgi:hypothetical protein
MYDLNLYIPNRKGDGGGGGGRMVRPSRAAEPRGTKLSDKINISNKNVGFKFN